LGEIEVIKRRDVLLMHYVGKWWGLSGRPSGLNNRRVPQVAVAQHNNDDDASLGLPPTRTTAQPPGLTLAFRLLHYLYTDY
jgi:hypothetical protein